MLEVVCLPFYPNFNLSLLDSNLATTLKVQIQLQGAEQITSAKIATLDHQLVYRLQNYALDLPTPQIANSEALMILVESEEILTIIQIPRQVPRQELIKLMPLECYPIMNNFIKILNPYKLLKVIFRKIQIELFVLLSTTT